MIKIILLCLAVGPVLLTMWAMALRVLCILRNFRYDVKDNARRVKEFCANRKGEQVCHGCMFANSDGDCSLYVKLPEDWEL